MKGHTAQKRQTPILDPQVWPTRTHARTGMLIFLPGFPAPGLWQGVSKVFTEQLQEPLAAQTQNPETPPNSSFILHQQPYHAIVKTLPQAALATRSRNNLAHWLHFRLQHPPD